MGVVSETYTISVTDGQFTLDVQNDLCRVITILKDRFAFDRLPSNIV